MLESRCEISQGQYRAQSMASVYVSCLTDMLEVVCSCQCSRVLLRMILKRTESECVSALSVTDLQSV